MRFIISVPIGILLLSLTSVSFGQSNSREPGLEAALKQEIKSFAKIDEQLYRGAQPTAKGLELLKQLGIQTVINFRHQTKLVEKERLQVKALGMNNESIPWRIQRHPKSPVMHEFLKLLQQKERGPFFVHCRRGAERTGTADALYRYYFKQSSFDDSWNAATEGYHVSFVWRPFILSRYKDFIRDLGSQESWPSSQGSRNPSS